MEKERADEVEVAAKALEKGEKKEKRDEDEGSYVENFLKPFFLGTEWQKQI